MSYLKIFIVGLLATVCSADEELENLRKLVQPCSVEDSKCLKDSLQELLQKTYAGIPAFDIRPIDPIKFDTMLFMLSVDKNFGHRLSNCTVDGYKDQRITEYKINTALKYATIKSTADLHYSCDLTVYFYEEKVDIELGIEEVTSTVHLDSTFGYSVKNEGGVEHYDITEEEVGCYGSLDVPGSFTLHDPEALQKFDAHPSIIPKKDYVMQHQDMFLKKAMCAVAKYTFGTSVNNLRNAARVLPKSAFFKDM